MESTLTIRSLNSIKYVYNYKYNLLLNKDLYDHAKIERLASRYYKKSEIINKSDFLTNNRLERYRCLSLVLTDSCNLRCKYCANSSVYEYSKGYSEASMSIETMVKAIDIYTDNYKRGVLSDPSLLYTVVFYGGEPLLEFDKIKYAVDYITSGLKISTPMFLITTNGYSIDSTIIEFFKENFFKVSISMDGNEKIHNLSRRTIKGGDSFNVVLENFKSLQKALGKDNVGIIATFDTQSSPLELYNYYRDNPDIDSCLERVGAVAIANTSYYSNIVHYKNYGSELMLLYRLYRNGVKNNYLNRLVEQEFVKLSARKEFIDKTYLVCPPMSAKFTVTPNGLLHICEKLNENYSFGHVDTGIDKLIAYQYYWNIINVRKNECSNCPFLNLCDPCFATLNREGAKFKTLSEECKEMRRAALNLLEVYCTFLDDLEFPDVISSKLNEELYEKYCV